MARRRCELMDGEWSVIEPLLPNKPRGVLRCVDRCCPSTRHTRRSDTGIMVLI